MKQFTMLIAVALAGNLLWSGCGKTEQAPTTSESPAAAKPGPLPTSPAAQAPTSSPEMAAKAKQAADEMIAAAKSTVSQAMALAKEGKFEDALNVLQEKIGEVSSNADAKKLIDDAIAQVKKMMTDAATKAATDKVGGALGGVPK